MTINCATQSTNNAIQRKELLPAFMVSFVFIDLIILVKLLVPERCSFTLFCKFFLKFNVLYNFVFYQNFSLPNAFCISEL